MTKDSKKLSVEERQEKQRHWVESILKSAQCLDWHGTISIVIKNGEVTLLKKEETFLIPKYE